MNRSSCASNDKKSASSSSSSPGLYPSSPPSPAASNNHQRFHMELTQNDVMLGRGTGPNEHKGNIRFRQLVSELAFGCKDAQELAQKKSALARKVVESIEERGGSFLRKLSKADIVVARNSMAGNMAKDKNQESPLNVFEKNQDVYVLVNPNVALEKAKQSFRHQQRMLDQVHGGTSTEPQTTTEKRALASSRRRMKLNAATLSRQKQRAAVSTTMTDSSTSVGGITPSFRSAAYPSEVFSKSSSNADRTLRPPQVQVATAAQFAVDPTLSQDNNLTPDGLSLIAALAHDQRRLSLLASSSSSLLEQEVIARAVAIASGINPFVPTQPAPPFNLDKVLMVHELARARQGMGLLSSSQAGLAPPVLGQGSYSAGPLTSYLPSPPMVYIDGIDEVSRKGIVEVPTITDVLGLALRQIQERQPNYSGGQVAVRTASTNNNLMTHDSSLVIGGGTNETNSLLAMILRCRTTR